MILTVDELRPKPVLPGVADRETASRVSSFVCLLAALWFFLSPWAFFGVSELPSGWNCWLVGGLAVLISIIRLGQPGLSTPLSWINAAFGIWILCSPFIFGYTGNVARMTNSIGVGACLVGFSMMARFISYQLTDGRSQQDSGNR